MKLPAQKTYIEKTGILLLIVLIPILRTDKTLDPNLHLQYISLTVLLTVFWFMMHLKEKELIIRDNTVFVFLSIYLLFLTYSLLSAGISINLADGIFVYTKYLLFFLLLLTILFIKNSDNLFSTVSRSAVILSTVVIIPAFYQLINLIKDKELIIPLSTYSIFSLFPHRNLFSEIVLLILPFSVYSYFSERSFWKFSGIICFDFALFLLIVLSNRASWLGLVTVGITVIIILLIKKKVFNFQKQKVIFLTHMVVIVLISCLFLFNYSDTTSLRSHTLNTLDFKQGSTKDRVELWTRTIKLIGEKPLFGGGLESWKINMLSYGNEGLVSENNTTFYQRPHNDFLWVAAEQGIIGFILYSLLFIFMLISLLKTLFAEKDKQLTNQLLVIVSVTMSFLVFSLFSFPKERISHNILLFTSWGLFLHIMNSRSEINAKRNIRLKGRNYFILLILVILFFIGIMRIYGEMHTKKAILAKKNSRFQKCITEINKAESFFYKIDETSTPLNWYAGLAYFKLKEYGIAAEKFEMAMQDNPYHIYVLNDYAGSLVKTNQKEKAITYYNKALAIAPNFLEPKLNLCAIYYTDGKYEEAYRILKSTDIENTSERYLKTVSVIVKRIIDVQIKTRQPSSDFIHLYQRYQDNYTFYKTILANAKKLDLPMNELLEQADFLFIHKP
jgi:O-antigen ligase